MAITLVSCTTTSVSDEESSIDRVAAGGWDNDYRLFVPDPRPGANQFTKGGQTAWFHDQGFPAGYFHTYDGLKVGAPYDSPRKVHVFLPRNYEASGKLYPVVYLNDGNTTFWKGGAANQTWDAAAALATLYSEQSIRKVIIVAVYPLDRNFEYLYKSIAPPGSDGGLDGYSNYMADKVKGFIDQNYRTRPEPEHTTIIGSSHGGLAAFYMAARRPDAFGSAGCLSPSFWAGTTGRLASSALVDRLRSVLANPSIRPTLWIDWGLVRSGGTHNSIIEKLATDRGIEMVDLLDREFNYVINDDLFAREDPRGEHNETSWARRLPDVLRALVPNR